MYCKRLIEVDLPIKRISAHARREKSIRHGHICTMHIWWARRPLAACRAVLCAALWPDPADPMCPNTFRDRARDLMVSFAQNNLGLLSAQSFTRFNSIAQNPNKLTCNEQLRGALLDFISDFSNWDNSTRKEFIQTSGELTKQSVSELVEERPLVLDSFAGGGSIPLEAMRVGANVFASDLNPIPVLLNKVILEFVPKYGARLSEEILKWGKWINEELKLEMQGFYPKGPTGDAGVVYLWARKIVCEGPNCGIEIPLLKSYLLSKKEQIALFPDINHQNRNVEFRIIQKQNGNWVDTASGSTVEVASLEGTVKRSSAICPSCGYTNSAERTRAQFVDRNGGADDAQLIAVVEKPEGGRTVFRLPFKEDYEGIEKARSKLISLEASNESELSIVPDEPLPYLRSIFNVHLIGIDEWGKLFTRRQALALALICNKIKEISANKLEKHTEFSRAVVTCLAFSLDRCADYWSSIAVWAGEFVAHTFGRQALGIVWDFAEVNGFEKGSGNFLGAIDWICRSIDRNTIEFNSSSTVERASATSHPLPDDCVNAFVTDPPYYDAVPYADLSDFFYVWLRRSLGEHYPDLFNKNLAPKNGEIVQLAERNKDYQYKTREYFESLMKEAMGEGRRVLTPSGIAVVVFAHKSTQGWETQLRAMIDAGWVITASWPIDTERPGRLRANNSAALASSVHLVCRPRDSQQIGDWSDVLAELPVRVHEWMPRLAEEGVVGADAIFACLGPALEVYSRYSSVEKASGEQVELKEYMEHIWAAVSKEALSMLFEDADASGFEEDARLTAMWLWTLVAEAGGDDEEAESSKDVAASFGLEYDTARKIAQGLGAHLEDLDSVVEIKGDKARLLSVSERTKHLFGKDGADAPVGTKKKSNQMDLFNELTAGDKAEVAWDEKVTAAPGETTLDRVHQSMILFAAGRGEAMKRFLVEDGAGRNPGFWKLAQALSALYPKGTQEKRWVDGVLARKKGLGL
jgi:putative DNA methylase